jgi:hypothetical protein
MQDSHLTDSLGSAQFHQSDVVSSSGAMVATSVLRQ